MAALLAWSAHVWTRTQGKDKQIQICCPGYGVRDYGKFSICCYRKVRAIHWIVLFLPTTQRKITVQTRYCVISGSLWRVHKPGLCHLGKHSAREEDTMIMTYLDGRQAMTGFPVMRPPILAKRFQPRLLHCLAGG